MKPSYKEKNALDLKNIWGNLGKCAAVGALIGIPAHADSPKQTEKSSLQVVQEAELKWADIAAHDSVSNTEFVERCSARLEALKQEAVAEGINIPGEAVDNALMAFGSVPDSHVHISFDDEGEIVCQWRNGERRLTLYINSGSISFVKSWGTDIFDQMSDGEVNGEPGCSMVDLWDWLQS